MHVEHVTPIAAPPDLVWSVVTDVERWPDLASTMTSVVRLDDGPFRLGSQARIKQPAQPEAVWTVTEFAAGEGFTWETRRAGLRMAGVHRVTPSGTGSTNHLAIDAEGPLAVLFGILLRPLIRKALEEENAGFKARCEALDGGRADEAVPRRHTADALGS